MSPAPKVVRRPNWFRQALVARQCCPVGLAFSGLLLLAMVGLLGCGPQVAVRQSTQQSMTTDICRDSTTTTAALAVHIPPELSRFAPLVKRLQDQGVAVTELRQMPSFAHEYGAGVEVVVRSQSTDQRGTPEDVIAAHLILRAGALEKAAGVDINAVGVGYLRNSGEVVESTVLPIEKTVDPSWYEEPGLTLDEVSQRARADVSARLAPSPFRVAEVKTTQDPDGTRVLWLKLSVAGVAVANDSIRDATDAMAIVYRLNAEQKAKIGILRTEIDTTSGEAVLWVITDLQLQSGTAWGAPGLTNIDNGQVTVTTVGKAG